MKDPAQLKRLVQPLGGQEVSHDQAEAIRTQTPWLDYLGGVGQPEQVQDVLDEQVEPVEGGGTFHAVFDEFGRPDGG